MRSLQNNYNLIREGKGNKELFMKQVRREFPQYISNVQTFDQAVTKLKEKSIISENTTSNITAPIKDVNWFNIFQENLNEVKATEKKTSKEVEEVQSKAYDYSDLDNTDNVFGQEFLTGYYAEMKDPKNAEKTEEDIKKIVAKNLAKDELYYVKDGQFGVKGLGYVETPTKEAEGKYKSSGYGTIKESIDEIGMINDPVGYQEPDTNPKDSIFTKKYASQGVYDIFKHGAKIKTINGEGEANAWMNQARRDLKKEEVEEEGLMDLEKLIEEILNSKI